MIKDKITPELKRRFIEDIKITKDIGKERGFFFCENKEQKLIPAKSCEGTSCELLLGDPRKVCPPETKPFGDFHTHPYMHDAKVELKNRGEKIPPDEELRIRFNKNIREAHEKITGVKGITVSSPSYTDILQAL